MKKLVESGLVNVSRMGNQKHFQAHPDSPIFGELCGLIRKTVGLIELALVYGSIARGGDTATSDINLLLVSDSLTLERAYRILDPAEQSLARKVHPTLYTPREFAHRLRDGNPFLTGVLQGEVIVLIGSLPDESK